MNDTERVEQITKMLLDLSAPDTLEILSHVVRLVADARELQLKDATENSLQLQHCWEDLNKIVNINKEEEAKGAG
jgi:hypothetical protein